MWTSEHAGRLIDLDLSCISDEARYGPEDVALTFSTPFLTLDLLTATTPKRHLYRHDLEAFYWSFVWIVLGFSPYKSPSYSIEGWRFGGLKRNIVSSKSKLLRPHVYNEGFSQLSLRLPSYEPVATCLKKLTELVANAYIHLDTANSDPSQSGSYFDDNSYVTGGGCITYEAFWAIFTSVCSGEHHVISPESPQADGRPFRVYKVS